MSKSKKRAEMARAIDKAILKGLRLYRPDGRRIRTGRELLSLEPKCDLDKGGYYFPVEADIKPQPPIGNN